MVCMYLSENDAVVCWRKAATLQLVMMQTLKERQIYLNKKEERWRNDIRKEEEEKKVLDVSFVD